MASMVNTIIARAAPLLNIRVNPKKSYASEKYVTVANIKNKMKERMRRIILTTEYLTLLLIHHIVLFVTLLSLPCIGPLP